MSVDYLLDYIPYENSEEKQLLSDYYKLTEQQKRTADSYDQINDKTKYKKNNFKKIPFI